VAAVRDVLVDDDLYRSLYKDSVKGRPSIPPSLVVLTMLLQYHDDCSDRETEARVRFDLRWKHALGLELEDTGFDRALFERLVTAAQGCWTPDQERAAGDRQQPYPMSSRSTGYLHLDSRRYSQALAGIGGHPHAEWRGREAVGMVPRSGGTREARGGLE